MNRFIDDNERRARLGIRHRLAFGCSATSPLEVARSLTAIHSTDPASAMIDILARCPHASIPDVEDAFYGTRTIVRLLGLRRTIFVVDWEQAPAFWVSSTNTVVRNQRRLLARALETSGVSDSEAWIAEVEQRLLAYLTTHPGSTSSEISASDPMLGYRVSIGAADAPDNGQTVASRLLISMSAAGHVVRGKPRGGWTSTQFTWHASSLWRNDWPDLPSAELADTMIARSWLHGHGPASIEDFAWWTGWPKGRSRNAIQRAGGLEVRTTDGTAYLLESDLEPVQAPEPWIAFLPGLDSTTMGWKQRRFYLDEHASRLFDSVGNAGPTIGIDGRIAGGWTQLDGGSIVYELYEELGRERTLFLDERADFLQRTLGKVRLKPRARRWTEAERSLRARYS